VAVGEKEVIAAAQNVEKGRKEVVTNIVPPLESLIIFLWQGLNKGA
jgi:hypothetical protein